MNIVRKLLFLTLLLSCSYIKAMEEEIKPQLEESLNILNNELNALAEVLKKAIIPIPLSQETQKIIDEIRSNYNNVMSAFDNYEEKISNFFNNPDILSPTREANDEFIKEKITDIISQQNNVFKALELFIKSKQKLDEININDNSKKKILALAELIKDRITEVYNFLQNIFNKNQHSLHHFQFYDIGFYGYADRTFESDVIGNYNRRMFYYAGPGGQRPLYDQL